MSSTVSRRDEVAGLLKEMNIEFSNEELDHIMKALVCRAGGTLVRGNLRPSIPRHRLECFCFGFGGHRAMVAVWGALPV